MESNHLEKIGHIPVRFKIENIFGNKGLCMAVTFPPVLQRCKGAEGIQRLAMIRAGTRCSPVV